MEGPRARACADDNLALSERKVNMVIFVATFGEGTGALTADEMMIDNFCEETAQVRGGNG